MREILFRAKRIDNGEWVEGCLVKYPSAIQIGSASPWYITVPPRDPDDNGGLYNVDPDTVCQYIGIRDKNGSRIFEGDLLDGFVYPYVSDDKHNYFAEVVWFDDVPAFGVQIHKYKESRVSGICSGDTELIYTNSAHRWKIIGNVFDNPELLEEKDAE